MSMNLSPKQPDTSWLLFATFLYLPLVAAFSGGADEPDATITISRVICFGTVILALVLALVSGALQRPPDKRITFVVVAFVVTYVLNYLLTDYASGKWLINAFGYLLIFYSVSTTMFTTSAGVLARASEASKRVTGIIMLALIAVNLYAVLLDPISTAELFLSGQHNSNLAFALVELNITKQSFGILFCLLVIWNALFWSSLRYGRKGLFILFLLTGLPYWIGIRTSILSIVLLTLYVLLVSKRWLRVGLVFVLLPLVPFLWEFDSAAVMDFLYTSYDRIYPLMFALDVVGSHPLGVGNGGYHLYVDENLVDITSRFAADNMSEFWVAPESDLAFFIASFGLLSVVFFGFYFYLLKKGAELWAWKSIAPFEKFVLLGCIMLIAAGVSQDNAGMPIWWVYMAGGFGVILRHQHQKRLGQAVPGYVVLSQPQPLISQYHQ